MVIYANKRTCFQSGVSLLLVALAQLLLLGAEPQPETDSLRQLIAQLQSPSNDEKIRAANVLGTIGKKANESIPVLRRALGDSDPEVRRAAAAALARVEGEAAVPALVRVLRAETDARTRLAIIRLFHELRAEAVNAIPVLIEMMRLDAGADVKKSDLDRANAAWRALISIGSKEITPLVRFAKNPKNSASDRLNVLDVMSRIGPKAKSIVPDLALLLLDKNEEIGRNSVRVLRAMGSEALVAIKPIEAFATRTRNPEVKVQCALALFDIGFDINNKSPYTIPSRILKPIIENGNAPHRRAAVAAAWAMGPSAAPLVPVLIKSLQDTDEEIRTMGALALGDTRRPEPAVISALTDAMKDKNASVREAARMALQRLGCKGEGTRSRP